MPRPMNAVLMFVSSSELFVATASGPTAGYNPWCTQTSRTEGRILATASAVVADAPTAGSITQR